MRSRRPRRTFESMKSVRHRGSVAAVLLAVAGVGGCGKQQDCERAMKVLNENREAMQALHVELGRRNARTTTERVRADRIKDEIGAVAKAAEGLAVKTEALSGPVATYREGLDRAAKAAAEMARATAMLSRVGPESEKSEAAAGEALRALESACPDLRGSCGDIKAAIGGAVAKPKDLEEAAAQVKAMRGKLEALKVDDPALVRGVQGAVAALVVQARHYDTMASAMKSIEASSKAFDAALDEAGGAHEAIEAVCH